MPNLALVSEYMTDILHIEVFIGRTHRHTHRHTDIQTDRVKTIPRNPLQGRSNNIIP